MRLSQTRRGGALVALSLLLLLSAAAGSARAAIFTVNSANDIDDGDCDASHCSLREAINAANAAPGADRIEFDIQPGGPVYDIHLTGASLPVLMGDVVVDGYTQQGASPNTRATGGLDTQLRIELRASFPSVGIGLGVSGSNVTIRGLAIRNFVAGIHVSDPAAVGVTVAGNFVGTAADGMTAANGWHGVVVSGGAGVTVGGTDPADRNLISGHFYKGVTGSRAVGSSPFVVRVVGNLIGTDITGEAALANGEEGIEFGNHVSRPDDSVTIGGTDPGEGNVIAGNTGDGISLNWTAGSAPGAVHTIAGNVIGMNWGRSTAIGNGGNGITFHGAIEATFGDNAVAFNAGRGVAINSSLTSRGTGVVLTHNDIYANTLLGVDLGSDGRTANDAGDSDTGPNARLNFPIVTRAAMDTISGVGRLLVHVRAAPNTDYKVELFNNGLSNPPAGYEAVGFFKTFLVTTDGSGDAVYEQYGATTDFDLGDSIVATLTDQTNHYTSEISDASVVGVMGPSISGNISAGIGTPLYYASVVLAGTESRTVFVIGSGDYLFHDLPAGGDYTVTPGTNGYLWAPSQRSFTNLSADQANVNFLGQAVPATYTVNVTHDQGDGWCSPAECTLAEALLEADMHPGPDRVEFAIPGAGPHVIALEYQLPTIGSDLIVDGYTQPGAVANTNVSGGLNGSPQIVIAPGVLAGTGVPALEVIGANVTIRGLVVSGFDIGATVSSGFAASPKVAFEGNYFGTTADGSAAAGTSMMGVMTMGDVRLTIGGTTPAARNLISGHMSAGIATMFEAPAILKVLGNLIGTDASGAVAVPNTVGILHTGGATVDDVVRIGGETAAERNVISGNEEGVFMMSGGLSDRDGSDKVIAGNYIGLAADGETALGNLYNGISGCGELKLTIKRNVIAHNGATGVSLCTTPTPTPFGVMVSENAIYENLGLAIDLEDDGRTDNDADDSDTGANDLQNFPVITSVLERVQGGATIAGALTSRPNREYRVELFMTGESAGSGLPGQNARAFVTSLVVNTNGSGVAAFSHAFASDAIATDAAFAATATDVTRMMTSELSDGVVYTPLPRFDVTGTITFKGSPLAGVEVVLSGDRSATTTTAADGRYAFVSVPMTGGYTVTPALAGYLFTPPNASIANLPDDTTADFVAESVIFTRYLSEGAVGPFWETSIALLNGSNSATTADVAFLMPDGRREPITVPLAGPGHAVIDPATVEALGGQAIFSTVITSTTPLVASRTMRWGGAEGLGAHAEQALSEPRTAWYFGEGVTGCADLFYLLVNPGAMDAQVEITYARRAPDAPIVRQYVVGANSRATIRVNAEDGLAGAEVSARIAVLNGQPIIAERSMYMSCFGGQWRGGHVAAASPAPANSWYFAEGATGSFFDLYLSIANFEPAAAELEIEYLLTDGSRIIKPHVVAAGSRLTIDVANEAPQLEAASVSAIVRATNNVPVIAERVQWWPDGGWYEGHVSAGVVESGVEWQIAGAQVGGAHGVHGYLLIANTGTIAGAVQVRAVFADGSSALLAQPITLGRHSRTTIALAEAFPQAAGQSFGVIVESLGAQPAPIVVELSQYNDTTASGAPRFWGAGTNVVATRIR